MAAEKSMTRWFASCDRIACTEQAENLPVGIGRYSH
jgi:hypothetical protein